MAECIYCKKNDGRFIDGGCENCGKLGLNFFDSLCEGFEMFDKPESEAKIVAEGVYGSSKHYEIIKELYRERIVVKSIVDGLFEKLNELLSDNEYRYNKYLHTSIINELNNILDKE